MHSLLRGKHFITTQEWTKEELDMVLDVAKDLKRRFALGEPHRLLQDKTLFMMFFEQSTRTRNSHEAGMTQLGGHAHDLTPDKMQISHGEAPKDTAKVLSRYGHGIAIRNCFFGIGNKYIREVAKHSSVPVFNMQCDIYHPNQAMADLMTIKEKFSDDIKGLNVSVIWAYTKSYMKPLSVPQSQILLFPRYGMNITLAYPKEFPLMPEIVEQAKANAEAAGCTFRITHDMDEAFKGAHVVIAKSWGAQLTTTDEQESLALCEKYKDWICDERRMALAEKNAIYMHALPADRGNEVTDAVIDGPQSVVFDAAENRLHITKALLALCMGGRP
ncbi:ornithine carbamoyltransferase [Anoxybacter fermentans]|uniref:Ornithine carbamoyltransferase n=1 Tax=Anoxybacter fermentans TaxID=1323375 RepID=A0A3Q9HSN9_9FIRM|nr:ornithine carbamoyltransferase [Anoxybacter fermentans]AZR73604.1 ornithine carbamoyltransferase [Anoxybacter fermentans]